MNVANTATWLRWTLFLGLLTGCGGSPTPNADHVTPLLQALAQHHVFLRNEGISQAFDSPGVVYAVDPTSKTEKLFIHSYPDAAAAAAVAAAIPPDGPPAADYIDEAHFFRCNTLLVLYLGTKLNTLDALTAECGAQFAGQ